MHFLSRFILFLFLIVFSTVGGAADKWIVNLDKGTGQVQFHAEGRPSLIKINGKGGSPKGVLTLQNGKLTGSITFDLSSLDTGIEKRNEHMKDKYLEVGKFPQATLVVTQLDFPSPPPSGDFSGKSTSFQGDLTLHGVSHAVDGEAKVSSEGGNIAVEANFETKISNYKIPVPTFSGITVADKVTVEVNFTAPLTVKK